MVTVAGVRSVGISEVPELIRRDICGLVGSELDLVLPISMSFKSELAARRVFARRWNRHKQGKRITSTRESARLPRLSDFLCEVPALGRLLNIVWLGFFALVSHGE